MIPAWTAKPKFAKSQGKSRKSTMKKMTEGKGQEKSLSKHSGRKDGGPIEGDVAPARMDRPARKTKGC